MFETFLCQRVTQLQKPLSEEKQRQNVVEVQAWEEAVVSPGMMAPETPKSNVPSKDEDMEIPVRSHRHPSSIPLSSEGTKSQRMDDG